MLPGSYMKWEGLSVLSGRADFRTDVRAYYLTCKFYFFPLRAGRTRGLRCRPLVNHRNQRKGRRRRETPPPPPLETSPSRHKVQCGRIVFFVRTKAFLFPSPALFLRLRRRTGGWNVSVSGFNGIELWRLLSYIVHRTVSQY